MKHLDYEDFNSLGEIREWLKVQSVELINIETTPAGEFRVWFYN